MIEIKPPSPLNNKKYSIFLAGSIEMDKAEEWQTKVANELKNFDVNILNPRRKAWDSSWKQTLEDKNFYGQVNWELDGLSLADLIVIYFQPGTLSPISLLELGLHAMQDNVLVCCPEGFWRKGNVEIVCERYDVPFYESLEDLILDLKENLPNLLKQFNV